MRLKGPLSWPKGVSGHAELPRHIWVSTASQTISHCAETTAPQIMLCPVRNANITLNYF